MLTDRERLRQRAAKPRIVALERALSRLTSTLTVMNTGAHPDDEQSGMLAVMRYAMGMRVVVACSTRGEGGQNTLGPERTGALGVMRSREMEEAAKVLDADIAWLGHGPDDPVHDFGFSKSGPDTLARWGRERTIERLVRAYRQFRPDIVIPTFLDVPGQHGHHRAMTEAAETALALAADPQAFPEHAAEGLAPWKVAKYYLPAWSGGGDTYDDEVPPPPATSHVIADGVDPISGMSYDRIGEVSRAFHASQNMGHWHPAKTQWPLHLVNGQAENDIRTGLPSRLADLGDNPSLGVADAAIARAVAAFPNSQEVASALTEAKMALAEAREALAPAEVARHGHRLARKQEEIDAALALAAGLEINARVMPSNVVPGGEAELIIEYETGSADLLAVSAVVGSNLVAGEAMTEAARAVISIKAKLDAAICNAFAPDFYSLGANGALSVKVEAMVAGQKIAFAVDTEEALQIVPPHTVELAPEALIIKTHATGTLQVAVKSDAPLDRISIGAADGLQIRRIPGGVEVEPAPTLQPGRYSLNVSLDGAPAYAVTPIAYPHIGRTHFVRPQTLEVLALDLTLPAGRIGYVGGGADRVGMWLRRMGADVTELDATALAGDLSRLDTIVVGIFAFGTRPDLAAATERLHDWVKAGGHLVTLYHRPSDGWNPGSTPPLSLTIGSPSLRWRVTNPDAPVELLAPDHPLLVGPNRISAADFESWDKERGLYFASTWDKAYVPLLGMNDAGEKQLTGSLLSAEIGKGRHTHTSLVLHHQLDKLVPGAFRLLANLVQSA
ncbi:hypothetical protein JP74_18155 [Devosia sp. 17-2-E-8]|nr:hypothetical protein JP74_18155 [Devosia sp. 17-2-E-8]